ncbi:uncharacterized protein PGTG_03977 [Puccinia graminis f. sp. tritici CRL 75-36-700-3]|uniref:Cyclopropane-fatty-acyl-phospholipid synthase n=1 Tax=Puccinia graminis f. sp. tritici (strain CRL 75-36-700-3 / race SCCL) TaxID=418459 RepID=E3K146_PUCGT|nr:uncharacterized protein PGTG_03977 [Puccinia graminis f. sp. tritici CRL 75-36-700-3]EFP78021.1 hypothetical protein PGTG_03977 [Puccinia graminis f. sp. tritici CRL 75-36-700-3]
MDEDYLKTKNYSQSSAILSLTNRSLHFLKESIVNTSTFSPIISLAKTTIISLMSKIEYGQIKLNTETESLVFGRSKVHPETSEELAAVIQVVNDAFWLRMFLLSDIGFAEAYMVGDIQVDRLDSLFKIFILNRSNLSEMSMITSSLFSTLNSIMNSRFVNSISNTISNISAHYDISNEMFQAFLSKDMTYSCAYFPPSLGGPDGDLKNQEEGENGISATGKDRLELAQYEKLDLIIEKAKIRKGDRVLEIGSGWGSFAIRAVERTGCQVDTITLSIEQKKLAEKRIRQAGLEQMITVHLVDYRDLPSRFKVPFDRIVSIEMIESVGVEFLDTYFDVVQRCLHPKTGIAVFQVITIPESRFDRYVKEVDFIRKWIFPGGILPSVTFMTNAISKGSKNRLLIDSIQNIGPHYARTLREWESRFKLNFDQLVAPCLVKTYPELVDNPHRIQIFKRKWIYYFEYCSTGFESRVLGDHIFTLTREGNLTL